MAQTVSAWMRSSVASARRQPLRWLSERYFFRDPVRPTVADSDYFFAPADGILLYQREVEPDTPIVEVKGRNYTLRDALRMPSLTGRALVIGIFMTSYDVHVNRVPYSGFLSYRELPPIGSSNRPMLAVEEALLRGHATPCADADYLFRNQRMLNSIRIPRLGLTCHVLQVADYDVETILPYRLAQHQPVFQNQRFSQIRFGSQVDLIIPCRPDVELEPLLADGLHVEAGLDALVRIHRRPIPEI